MKKRQPLGAEPSSQGPDNRNEDPVDWRGELLDRLRALIMEAEPGMTEERKWKKPSNPAGVPGCSHDGTLRVCDVPASVRSGRGPHRTTASRLISPWTIRSSVST